MSSIGHQQHRSFFTIPTTSNNKQLPVSHSRSVDSSEHGLRKRLSSFNTTPAAASASASAVWSSFPRSKSLSSMGDYAGTSIKNWWDWTWAWILSRKPIFARDLELNDQETKLLGGSHNRGTWRHVFYKLRSEIRRFIPPTNSHHHLPRTTPQADS
ncbi:uncharacterized protein LOC130732824 [Lotus japonicus]|uniref:Uncharacterized protein n=1 Tax=Lotus japonicus TaxID=34305 RepID=I3SZZ0_LOTJA|nr:uncharacterized protein LOC130732824 [Lotus japonicus]AFK45832.1 unknown [Lotus japonicus]